MIDLYVFKKYIKINSIFILYLTTMLALTHKMAFSIWTCMFARTIMSVRTLKFDRCLLLLQKVLLPANWRLWRHRTLNIAKLFRALVFFKQWNACHWSPLQIFRWILHLINKLLPFIIFLCFNFHFLHVFVILVLKHLPIMIKNSLKSRLILLNLIESNIFLNILHVDSNLFVVLNKIHIFWVTIQLLLLALNYLLHEAL